MVRPLLNLTQYARAEYRRRSARDGKASQFAALKQSLKIKTFVGTSANAVRTQIWTALIAMLLIKILQQRSTFAWALSNLIALLRWNLFTYRHLWEWINRPFDKPQIPPDQLELFDLDSIPQPT